MKRANRFPMDTGPETIAFPAANASIPFCYGSPRRPTQAFIQALAVEYLLDGKPLTRYMGKTGMLAWVTQGDLTERHQILDYLPARARPSNNGLFNRRLNP